jgi:hypothetical protein
VEGTPFEVEGLSGLAHALLSRAQRAKVGRLQTRTIASKRIGGGSVDSWLLKAAKLDLNRFRGLVIRELELDTPGSSTTNSDIEKHVRKGGGRRKLAGRGPSAANN